MNIVILTGAGISAESGISTYSGSNGLWMGKQPQEVASSRAMFHTPEVVINHFNEVYLSMKGKKPNKAHEALVQLEKHHNVTIVTQNVDNLHEEAGSSTVHHIHGSLHMCRNMETDEQLPAVYPLDPYGIYRPDVVLYGEYPMDSEALDAMYAADMFISIGTSGHVYPAAGYIDRIRMIATRDIFTVEVNISDTEISHKFDRRLRGNATEIVPKLVRELCQI